MLPVTAIPLIMLAVTAKHYAASDSDIINYGDSDTTNYAAGDSETTNYAAGDSKTTKEKVGGGWGGGGAM